MKVKLGLVLGANVAVACAVLQGCKKVEPGQSLASTDNKVVTVAPAERPAGGPVEGPKLFRKNPRPAYRAPEPRLAQPEPVVAAAPVEPPPPPPPAVEPAPAVKSVKPVATVAAAPAPAATVHVVKNGDSLSKISKKYNVKMAAIIAANPGLEPERIRIGRKINIPGSAAAPAAVAAEAEATPRQTKTMQAAANVTPPVKTKSAFKPYEGPTKEYTVKGGDSLGKIAVESGISIRALKALNGLTKDSVRAGQKLKIPAEKQVAAKKAEAPKAAADKPAAKAEAPKAEKPADKPAAAPAAPEAAAPAPAAAEAKPEEAAPASAAAPAEAPAVAEAAPAPAAAPAAEAGSTYTVGNDEDLVSIAIKFGISPSALMDLNDLKANDSLKPGQTLKLPAGAKAQ